MAKSQQSSNSTCLCKKIFGITCPICKSAPSHVSVQEKHKPKMKMAPPTNVLAEPSHAKANSKFEEKKKPKLETQLTKGNRTTSLAYNDAFSDYINRAKIRIKAMSNVRIEKNVSRSTDDVHVTQKEENSKDIFSDYIDRAKMRIRKTSSIGSRKIFSFK